MLLEGDKTSVTPFQPNSILHTINKIIILLYLLKLLKSSWSMFHFLYEYSLTQSPPLQFSSQVTCCSTSPLGAEETPVTLCHFLRCQPQQELSRLTFCVCIAWKSAAFCLDYVPFSTVTDLSQQGPHAS